MTPGSDAYGVQFNSLPVCRKSQIIYSTKFCKKLLNLFVKSCCHLFTLFWFCDCWCISHCSSLSVLHILKAFSLCSVAAVLCNCWRQEGHPACKKTEWRGTGMVICLEQGADLHMAQLMPLSLASVKSRLVLPFWYRLTWVVPEKRPLNGCVCVCFTLFCGSRCSCPIWTSWQFSGIADVHLLIWWAHFLKISLLYGPYDMTVIWTFEFVLITSEVIGAVCELSKHTVQ